MPGANPKLGLPLPTTRRHWLVAIGISLALVAVIILLVSPVLALLHKRPASPEAVAHATAPYSYTLQNLSPAQQSSVLPLLTSYAQAAHRELQEGDAGVADIVVTATSGIDPTPQPISSGNLLAGGSPATITVSFAHQLSGQSPAALQNQIAAALPSSPTWTYLALGDTIPARDVYTYSRRRNDFVYPFAQVKDRTSQADLTVTNLETTVADGQANSEGPGMMVFTAPARALDGLVAAGVDGVNLANNHATNGGASKVTEMLNLLQAKSIGSFGVGRTSSASRTWTTVVKGTTITHLGYDTVPGLIEATPTSAGGRRLPLNPWGTLSAADGATVQADIQAAKQNSTLVIPWIHWGTEYTHQANDEQRSLAHQMIDAGADIVIGSHPHWTQGLEWYKGHLIIYSLGNFVFDQNWSEETLRSVAVELTFSGSQLTKAQLLPVHIDNFVQPRFLKSSETVHQQILTDIAAYSWWPVK